MRSQTQTTTKHIRFARVHKKYIISVYRAKRSLTQPKSSLRLYVTVALVSRNTGLQFNSPTYVNVKVANWPSGAFTRGGKCSTESISWVTLRHSAWRWSTGRGRSQCPLSSVSVTSTTRITAPSCPAGTGQSPTSLPHTLQLAILKNNLELLFLRIEFQTGTTVQLPPFCQFLENRSSMDHTFSALQ